MRFGIDASELEGNPGGVGRCLRNWLQHWLTTNKGSEFYCYHRYPQAVVPPCGNAIDRPVPPSLRSPRFLWEQLDLPRKAKGDKVDLLFSPGYSMPALLRCTGVVAIHDVSFETHPEWFRWKERKRRQFLAARAAKNAALVVAGSSFAASEIIRHYRVPGEHILVVPYGIDQAFHRVDDPDILARVRRKYNIEGALILSVGALFTRRCTSVLLESFAITSRRRPGLTLMVVGKNLTYPYIDYGAEAKRLGIENQVLFSERVDDNDLVALYNLANVFVFLSEYEGFGLPPLEALACEVPVVTSGNTALKENLEGKARLLDTNDPDRLSAELLLLLEHPELGRCDSRRVEEIRRRYDWRTSAEAILEAMHRLAAGG